MECSLVMFKSDGVRLDIQLKLPRMVIGRMSAADIRIPLSSVSREHCELVQDGKTLKFKDLNSSNGVLWNGSKGKQGTLKAGDTLIIGPVVFTVVIDGMPKKVDVVRTILDTESPASSATGAAPSPAPRPAKPAPVIAEDDEFASLDDMTSETMPVPAPTIKAPSTQPKPAPLLKDLLSADLDSRQIKPASLLATEDSQAGGLDVDELDISAAPASARRPAAKAPSEEDGDVHEINEVIEDDGIFETPHEDSGHHDDEGPAFSFD